MVERNETPPERPAAPKIRLGWATPDGWFATATGDLGALLSDHLHCERKAAENALSLVRRYPHQHGQAETLARLAHEETSHIVQVAVLMQRRGLRVRADTPNIYARGLGSLIRGQEPQRLTDELLVGAFIEARSHERLGLLAAGFATIGDPELAAFYGSLAGAEERHAEIFVELAAALVPPRELTDRMADLAEHEAGIIASRPAAARVH